MSVVANWLTDRFDEIDPISFYREIFPEGSLQSSLNSYDKGEYAAIALVIRENDKNLRCTVTDSLETVESIVEKSRPGELCVLSPLSYAGISPKKRNVHAIFAFAFDVDGLSVGDSGEQIGLLNMWHQINKPKLLPKPTFAVASGTGIHLYYVLDKPLVVWPWMIDQIEILRRDLTRKLWAYEITDLYEEKEVQYEGFTQGFRMVGTYVKPKAGLELVRAFRTGEKVTLEYLQSFAYEEHKTAFSGVSRDDLSLEEAKEKWPEWYQNRIVDRKTRNTWVNKRALYDWWKRQVFEKGAQGHRYNCILALAAYAQKCAINRDELERDAEELRVILNGRGDSKDPFTKKDVKDALTAYRAGMITYPIDEIVARTGITIQKNKRNYRKQEQHLILARGQKFLRAQLGENVLGGRPEGSGTLAMKVWEYKKDHPDASQREIAKVLGISPTTVNKWLKVENWQTEYRKRKVDLSFLEKKKSEMTHKEMLIDRALRRGYPIECLADEKIDEREAFRRFRVFEKLDQNNRPGYFGGPQHKYPDGYWESLNNPEVNELLTCFEE